MKLTPKQIANVKKDLRTLVAHYGSKAAAGRAIGVTAQALGLVLNGRETPGAAMAEKAAKGVGITKAPVAKTLAMTATVSVPDPDSVTVYSVTFDARTLSDAELVACLTEAARRLTDVGELRKVARGLVAL